VAAVSAAADHRSCPRIGQAVAGAVACSVPAAAIVLRSFLRIGRAPVAAEFNDRVEAAIAPAPAVAGFNAQVAEIDRGAAANGRGPVVAASNAREPGVTVPALVVEMASAIVVTGLEIAVESGIVAESATEASAATTDRPAAIETAGTTIATIARPASAISQTTISTSIELQLVPVAGGAVATEVTATALRTGGPRQMHTVAGAVSGDITVTPPDSGGVWGRRPWP